MTDRIADYGLIGDGRTAALVGRGGGVDWLCLPHLDSPSVFAAILDDACGGRFGIRPTGEWSSVQRYLGRSNVLRTVFRTPEGRVEVLDFFPMDGEADDEEDGAARPSVLVRRVRALSGEVELEIECRPRFDYARVVPEVSGDGRTRRWQAGGEAVELAASRALSWSGESTSWTARDGDVAWFVLAGAGTTGGDGGTGTTGDAGGGLSEGDAGAGTTDGDGRVTTTGDGGGAGTTDGRADTQPALRSDTRQPARADTRPASADPERCERLLEETLAFWRRWRSQARVGKYPEDGFWQPHLDRAALVLKLLQMRETGAIAAAPSVSLPTIVHGTRNWDYRYGWIRDASLTATALFELGHEPEVRRFIGWVGTILRERESVELGPLYRLREPAPPEGERPLPHLAGHRASRPVHIGQYNLGQTQHDVYGELVELFFEVSHFVGKVSMSEWTLVRRLVDHVADIWRDPDHGIWELRTGPHHMVHSKLMCWLALDRGIKIAEHYGFPADHERWAAERDAVREEILERGCRDGRFVQHYDTSAVDAALLLVPLTGFLPAHDERVARTIETVEKDLMPAGLVMRYVTDDGLPGQEHAFLICHFWYLQCLIRQGRLDEVEHHLRRLPSYASPLGLFAEQYDPEFREVVGNYPQAFSHIGYVNVVHEYLDARRPPPERRRPGLAQRLRLLVRPRDLSPPPADETQDLAEHPGAEVRRTLLTLMGWYYDGHDQRVDYDRIRGSPYYAELQAAVGRLHHFDPATLPDDAERMAFWINVYLNVADFPGDRPGCTRS